MSFAILPAAVAGRVRRDPAPANPFVARFAPDCRAAVARTCARDPRLGDLASSFPALLHRIAIGRDAEGAAIVLRGGSLKRAAAASGLPMWTRRLPPEAFGPVAHDLPGGAAFSRRIANALPRGRRTARGWLDRVAEAVRWGEADFVIWAAAEARRRPAAIPVERLKLLALHAFFSARPDTAGGALPARRWSSTLQAPQAIERAGEWLQALEAAVTLGGREIDSWFAPGHADGFEFLPVVSHEALIEEAAAMDNCVRYYAQDIACDSERLWSVRRGGERVATLSVRFGEAPFAVISELKGPRNEAAPHAVWFATRKWLEAQDDVARREADWDRPLDRATWIRLWKPYWLARGRAPAGVALAPSRDALEDLRARRRRRRRRARA